ELRDKLLELIEDLNALNESNRQLLMEALKFNELSMKAVIGSENQQTYKNPGKAGKDNKSNRIINRQA
ncbi:MAG: flagellar export chaperone FlgN, partial [Halarsenatibacteraceae bacterium]